MFDETHLNLSDDKSKGISPNSLDSSKATVWCAIFSMNANYGSILFENQNENFQFNFRYYFTVVS